MAQVAERPHWFIFQSGESSLSRVAWKMLRFHAVLRGSVWTERFGEMAAWAWGLGDGNDENVRYLEAGSFGGCLFINDCIPINLQASCADKTWDVKGKTILWGRPLWTGCPSGVQCRVHQARSVEIVEIHWNWWTISGVTWQGLLRLLLLGVLLQVALVFAWLGLNKATHFWHSIEEFECQTLPRSRQKKLKLRRRVSGSHGFLGLGFWLDLDQ